MNDYDVAIVGAGFTGLSAARTLTQAKLRVCVIDKDVRPGGLAGTFTFSDQVEVEKFYHHWFNNDEHVVKLVSELGLKDQILIHPSRTGMYRNGRIWKLSSPLDLLKFKPLSLLDRIRLGLLVPRIKRLTDWRTIEHLSIREWLEPLCGKKVFSVIWEPLINAKFSIYADSISAVWMWKKLALRGGTRNKKGAEELCYFNGGFGKLAKYLVSDILGSGGHVSLGVKVDKVNINDGQITSLQTSNGEVSAKHFLFTQSLPQIADTFKECGNQDWLNKLKSIRYLGNICLVLRLDRSLSNTYWLNVNDPGFPFVGVIEHTNFDSPENYGGDHIVYLSRYLPVEDPLWNYTEQEYFEMAVGYLQKMFPEFEKKWIIEYKDWRDPYAQPVTERNYSSVIPEKSTPFVNGKIATMAQIYPEDRGTNYAIRDGKLIAEKILAEIQVYKEEETSERIK